MTGLPARLRRDTRAAHRALEAILPVARAGATLGEYRDHLRYLLGFYRPVELRLARVPGLTALVPALDRRWKSAELRADLGLWAAGPRPLPHSLPEPRTAAQGLGVLYVLEGATLGAQTLLPKLRADGVIPGEIGSSYLTGYGSRTPVMWGQLSSVLEGLPQGAADDVVAHAQQTFASLIAWRREWESRR